MIIIYKSLHFTGICYIMTSPIKENINLEFTFAKWALLSTKSSSICFSLIGEF